MKLEITIIKKNHFIAILLLIYKGIIKETNATKKKNKHYFS